MEQKKKNEEFEKKVALAARGITRNREIEKEKLTQINLIKQKQKEEHLHLQNSLKKELHKNKSTQLLKTELMQQMSQRRNETQIEKS